MGVGPVPPSPPDPLEPVPQSPHRRPQRAKGWRVGLALILSALLLAVGVVGAAGYLYARDQGFGAHVTGKECRGPLVSDSQNRVHLRTTFLAIDHTVHGVPDVPCSQIQPGYFVEHHIRSKHTIIYDRQGGDCVYDTQKGINC